MQFAPAKSAAAIGYLVKSTRADLYSVMKMLYLADKVHMGRYGRTITGDEYVAMEKGPVPERSYNLCKFVRGNRSSFDPLPNARDLLGMEGNNFILRREPDLNELSRSDLQALDEVCEIHRRGGWRAVAEESHDDAWKTAWHDAEGRDVRMVDMDINAIASTLPNAAALIDYLADPHPGEEVQPRDD